MTVKFVVGAPCRNRLVLVGVLNINDRQRPNPRRPRAGHCIIGQHVSSCAGVRVRDYGVRVRNCLRRSWRLDYRQDFGRV